MNYLTAEMEAASGVYGLLPRFPERQAIIHTGEVTLNNIRVSDSEIGVLNTGAIENVDSTLTVLKTEGSTELATIVRELSEAIIKSDDITNNQKNEALELIGTLSQEAVCPPHKRKVAVVKAVLGELSSILGTVSTLGQAFEKACLVFQKVFGLDS
jgi:hypothetical protein